MYRNAAKSAPLWALALLILVGLSVGVFSGAAAQGSPTPAPLQTLVPPTPYPPAPTATPPPPLTRSAVARIRERDPQKVIVGIPFNIRPFASISPNGEIEGFEADIARAIAEDWGVNVEFRAITRLNGIDLLRRGEIDLLMGQQIVSRDDNSPLDFSEPIFIGKHVALAMADAPQQNITDLGGQNVGVVIASTSEEAFGQWAAASGLQANVVRFAMLDDGLRALSERQIAALVGDRWELDRRVRGQIDGVKLLGGVFRTEPYGIAMLRYDENLRTLVNRALQNIVRNDLLNPIYAHWFPAGLLDPADQVVPRVWKDLATDTRSINDFPVDVVRPARSVIERIRAGEPIRVAGLGIPAGPDGRPNVLENFDQALVNEMARRWGARLELVPGSFANAEDVLASGAADLAVGLEPRWGPADRVDYAGIYAERGYRMMVRVGSNVEGFGGLREGQRTIGTFSDETQAFEVARKLAVQVGIPEQTVRNIRINDPDEAVRLVFENNIRALFGDALRVVPLAQANPARVVLTPRLYDGRPLAFGVPRNDVDFRMLVDITLQEMARDGTYERLWREQWNMGDPLKVIVWPGGNTPFGIRAGG